jgi:uncharacterized protein
MAQPKRLYDGFIPGSHTVDGYAAGGFSFAGMSHRGSILALPSGIRAWSVRDMAGLTPDSLKDVLAEPAGSIEFLLFGTGDSLQPLPKAIRTLLHARHLRCDPMATAHAISTYNILLEEKRLVAAALIATG